MDYGCVGFVIEAGLRWQRPHARWLPGAGTRSLLLEVHIYRLGGLAFEWVGRESWEGSVGLGTRDDVWEEGRVMKVTC